MIKLIKDSPEVHSLEESLNILDSYRDRISRSSYACLYLTIHDLAIEGMYLNAADISANLAMLEDGRSFDELLAYRGFGKKIK